MQIVPSERVAMKKGTILWLGLGIALLTGCGASSTSYGSNNGALGSAKKEFVPNWPPLRHREKPYVWVDKVCTNLLCTRKSEGTAFEIPHGWWFTPYHVVRGAHWRESIYDGNAQKAFYRDSVYPSFDAALYYTKHAFYKGSPPLPLGTNADISDGEAVGVLGHPNGDPTTEWSAGRVIGGIEHRHIRADGDVLTYPILLTSENNSAPGSSGSVVISGHGNVIGMVIAGNPSGRGVLVVPPSSLEYAVQHCKHCNTGTS